MTPNTGGEYIVAAVKASPSVMVSGMTMFGIPLNEIVLLLTALYTVLQIGWFMWDHFIKDKVNGRRRERA
ncbi:pinholin [Caulobacter phage Percy]|uniref:Pinholin n=1 Tax=Caulobacter phage Percy TaxID=1701809 RepID=A0A0M4S4Y5_9CAUD|nr:holin [Caulobacter phage Percy]ALF01682.1 pinholin [Caulobacter phage Percy]